MIKAGGVTWKKRKYNVIYWRSPMCQKDTLTNQKNML